MDDAKKMYLNMEINRARSSVERSMDTIYDLLDRIKRDLEMCRKPTVSNTATATDLFNALGRLEALMSMQEMVEGK